MKKGKQQHPHFKERSFGISVGSVLLLIAAYMVWRGRITAAEITGGIGAVLLILGLTRPICSSGRAPCGGSSPWCWVT